MHGQLVEIDVRPFFPIHQTTRRTASTGDPLLLDRSPDDAGARIYVMREYNESEPDKIRRVAFTRIQTPIPPPAPPLRATRESLS